MPRGKASNREKLVQTSYLGQPRKIQKDDEWGGFVPYSISDDRKEPFQTWWAEDPVAVRQGIDDAVASGLKLTLTYDGSNQCYIASLTGRPDSLGERAFTCCLSARAGTFDEALALLIFKHVACLHTDWWDQVNRQRPSGYTFG